MIKISFNTGEEMQISKFVYQIDFKFTDLETPERKITKIIFPNGTIKAKGISNLSELTEVVFNQDLLEIECFHSNPNLTEVNFPDSLRNLFYFEGDFNNLYLPKNVQKVFLGYCECCNQYLRNLTGDNLWLDCDPLMLIYQPNYKKHSRGNFIENYYGSDFDNITPCGIFNEVRIPETATKCCNGAFSTNYYGPYSINGHFGYASSNYVKSTEQTYISKYIYDESQRFKGIEERYKQILLDKEEYDRKFSECPFKPTFDKFTIFDFDFEKNEVLQDELNLKIQTIEELNSKIKELEQSLETLQQEKQDLNNEINELSGYK